MTTTASKAPSSRGSDPAECDMPRRFVPNLLVRVLALVAAAVAAPASFAQTDFFMVINGRVSGANNINAGPTDRVVAVVGGQNFSAQTDAAGLFQGLTIIRPNNNADPVRFEFRKGSTRYALVLADGDTAAITIPFEGSPNPLGAALSPTTVNGFIGPRLTGGSDGGGGGGDGPDGDPADIDGDGMITVNDARLVLRFIVGDRRGVTDASRFDVNGDGRVNTDDVVAILRREGEEAIVPPSEESEETQ